MLCDSIDLIKQLFCSGDKCFSFGHLVPSHSEFLAKLFAHEGVAIIVHINEYNFLICSPHEVTNLFRLK